MPRGKEEGSPVDRLGGRCLPITPDQQVARCQQQHEQRGGRLGQRSPEPLPAPARFDPFPAFQEGHRQRRGHGDRPAPGAPRQPALEQTTEQQLLPHRRHHRRREQDQEPLDRPRLAAGQLDQRVGLRRRPYQPIVPPARQELNGVDEWREHQPAEKAGEQILDQAAMGQAELLRPGAADQPQEQGDQRDLKRKGERVHPERAARGVDRRLLAAQQQGGPGEGSREGGVGVNCQRSEIFRAHRVQMVEKSGQGQ